MVFEIELVGEFIKRCVQQLRFEAVKIALIGGSTSYIQLDGSIMLI